MGCPKLLNNTKNLCIVSGTKYQPLTIAYKREAVLLNRGNRKYVSDSLDTERTTLHVMDNSKAIALIETETLLSVASCYAV